MSNAVSNDENKGELTVKFLKELDSNWDKVPTNEVELWNKIKFLNHLNFVDSRTIARYSKLNTYARLESEYEFNWINKIETIDISKNANLVEFITNKTSLKQYLGFEIEEDKTTYQTNNRLNEAFDLYKDKQYANAKSKFRELANEAFVQKDYWTYLIAEFNIEHIGQSFLEEPVSIPDPIVTGVTFSKVIESLLLRGDNETKQLVKYFQDEIYSFEFIYQNLFRINNLLNKIKSEHSTYKRGGYSQNNYLHEIRALMNNLITFIESNKITISDYSEYKQIVASYTEALLIALNMSKIVPKKNKLFPNVTSTILETLTWNDIEIILDSWDAKNIDLIMEDCDFNEIQVDEEVFNKLIFVICNGIKEGTVQNNEFKRQQYLKLISMLKQVRIYDVDAVVSILNDLDLNVRNINAIKNLLAIIVTNVERVDNREKLFAIINDEINATLSDEVVRNAVINQFAQYKFILKKINLSEKQLDLPKLEKELYFLTKSDIDLNELMKFGPVIENMYPFFDEKLKKIIQNILMKYSRKQIKSLDFVLRLKLANIFDFSDLRTWILEESAVQIQLENKSNIKSVPDRVQFILNCLITFYEKKEYTREEIEAYDIFTEELRGVYAEVDWLWYETYNSTVANNLLEIYSFKEAKKLFADTVEKENIFNQWAINKVTNEHKV